MVPAALVTNVGDKVIASAGSSSCRLRGAEVAHVEVFDGEIDNCRVLFAAVLSVPHKTLGVHDDVGRKAANRKWVLKNRNGASRQITYARAREEMLNSRCLQEEGTW